MTRIGTATPRAPSGSAPATDRSRRWRQGVQGAPAQAEQWASEFEHLPDHRSEITRVWLASKLRMDAFPRTERLIYERTLKRDLDFASQWHAPQPPSSKVVAFASCVAVLGLAGPVYCCSSTRRRSGRRELAILLNFFFEFMLVYFLIVPLMILFNKIFLPSLLDERLQQVALEDDEVGARTRDAVRPTRRPRRRPTSSSREPELKALVDERGGPGHGHAPRSPWTQGLAGSAERFTTRSTGTRRGPRGSCSTCWASSCCSRTRCRTLSWRSFCSSCRPLLIWLTRACFGRRTGGALAAL